VVIQRYCAAGNCYRGSDVRFGPETLEAFPVRAIAWLPPLMWRAAAPRGSWLGGLVLIVAVLVIGWLAWQAIRDLPRLSRVGRRAALALAVTAGTLVLLGAGMGSLNADVQQLVASGRWGYGWRDSAVTATAGALLLVGLIHLVRVRWATGVLVAAIVLFAAAATVSAAANKRQRDIAMTSPAARLADRLAVEMADFDPGSDGAARRCALRAAFVKLHPDSPFSVRRFDESLEIASRRRADVPFCPGVTG
jgi:hypothetical protein